MTLQDGPIGREDVVDNLSDTVGKKKAEDLLESAIDESDVDPSEFDHETAVTVLETITEMDDVSTLASVAANTTLAKIRG